MTHEWIEGTLKYYQMNMSKDESHVEYTDGDITIDIYFRGRPSSHHLYISRNHENGGLGCEWTQKIVDAPLQTGQEFKVGYDVIYLTFYGGIQIEIAHHLVPIRG